jgi:hypothetical protein
MNGDLKDVIPFTRPSKFFRAQDHKKEIDNQKYPDHKND